ncbi:MAG: amidophosphoribosyltransferase [Alphaproteobacteria bacterium]
MTQETVAEFRNRRHHEESDPTFGKPKEECGIFAVWNDEDAAAHTALGLHALQHRGQDGAGIVAYDGKTFNAHRGAGHVGEIFSSEKVINHLKGPAAIGHNRYATSGGSAARNIQPIYADMSFGGFAVAHNGNLTNAYTIREELRQHGALFQSTSDTEVIVHLMARSVRNSPVDRLIEALQGIEGAYSLVCMTKDCIIGVRDPRGVRPLVLGKLGDSYVLTSETCALDIFGADFVRDVEPGEVVVVSDKGLESYKPFAAKPPKPCIFEFLYFARPDSMWLGRDVYEVRKLVGHELHRETPVDADVVVPVPDSGVPAALGYAEASGIPFELGIIRNHYVGRTFIEPTQQIRNLGVRLKHNANKARLNGKRVILVDDSIVRGTTMVKIVEMVRLAGAKEVHLRIAAPPTANPCFYGINTPSQDQLLAHKMPVQDMAEFVGADSLEFISVDGLYRAVGEAKRNMDTPQFCDACFTGDYPTKLEDHMSENADKLQLSLLAET